MVQGANITAWTDTAITFVVPRNSTDTSNALLNSGLLPRAGGYSVSVVTTNSRGATPVTTRSGVTVYSTSTGNPTPIGHTQWRYNPTVFTVNKPSPVGSEITRNATTVQGALDLARTLVATGPNSTVTPLVVVYPNAVNPTGFNPHQAYYENVIVQGQGAAAGLRSGRCEPGHQGVDPRL